MKITINEDEEVYIPDLIRKLKELIDFDDGTVLFYFDSVKNLYVNLQE
jgi:hypothetical protein